MESLWIEISLPHTKRILISVIYRPPSSGIEFFQNFEKALSITVQNNCEVFILGDFNIDLSGSSSNKQRKLSAIMKTFQLTQIISTATRSTNTSATCIDHIYVSDNHRIGESGVITAGFSDHDAVFVTRKCKLPAGVPKLIKTRKFKNFDPSSFIRDLQSVPWNLICISGDVEHAWAIFKQLLLNVCNRHAPIVTQRVRGYNVPWINDEIRATMLERDHMKQKAKQTKNSCTWEDYKRLRNKVTQSISRAKSDYYKNLISENSNNPSKLWSIIKSLVNKNSSPSINVLKVGSNTFVKPVDIANSLNRFFTSIGNLLAKRFNVFDNAHFPHLSCYDNIQTGFSFSNISTEFVRNQLCNLQTNKSSGLDNIHTRFFKVGASVLAEPLTMMFNLSLSTNRIPAEWKTAKVTPLFKSGDTTDPENYRPISVLPVVCKIFERAIHDQLYSYLRHNRILSETQSGFRSKHSTSTTLMMLQIISMPILIIRNLQELFFSI